MLQIRDHSRQRLLISIQVGAGRDSPRVWTGVCMTSFSLHVKRSGRRLIKPLSRTRDPQRDFPVEQKRPLRGPLCTGEYCEGSRRTGPSRRTVSRVVAAAVRSGLPGAGPGSAWETNRAQEKPFKGP